MTTITKALFGRMLERDVAVHMVRWTGNLYFACAGALAITSLLKSAPSLIGMAIAYAACGFFVAFKVSRIAAMVGLLLTIACFFVLPAVLPTVPVFVVFFCIEWMAIRAAEASFKLHGRLGLTGRCRRIERTK